MNKKFKIIISLMISVILVLALVSFVGCKNKGNGGGGDNKVTEIYVTKADLPRVNYVEGQELDLTDGKLTAVVNGSETKVPLTAAEVTVSGYNKDTVGEQTITIQYSGLSTTITVTVAERTIAEKYETKYFVGDEFNADKGKIKITTDDAKSFYVNMNDEKVSVVSFDSSKAGNVPITLLYSDGTNSYYCQFDVMVYDQSNIEFTAPSKIEYLSHDEGISVNGGYFKVTSSDGTLTMNVPLSEKMITGFDLSAATIANRSTPLEQELTVKYLDKTFTYKISITFSGISAINYYVSQDLSKIDWAKAKEEGLSDKESESAIAAITEYYGLPESQQALISDETKGIIGRAGAIATTKLFLSEMETYSNSFKLETDNKIYFIKSSYEKTLADVERLNAPNAKLNEYADLLRNIETEFGELTIVEDVAIKDYIIVYSEEVETAIIDVLEHLVDVFALVKDIPAEWNAETLKAFGENISAAAMQMYVAGYYKQGNTAYYTNILSAWREKNDVFEILYTYFLYDYEGGKEFMTNYMWGHMPMPGLLEQWYTGLSSSMYYSAYYKQYASSNAFLTDLSSFMFNYFYTLELCEEIKNSGNQLWIDIYNTYNGDYINSVYMYSYSYGYLHHTNAMIDSEAFHNLWNKYYEVLKLYYNEKLSSETNKSEITAMFEAFEALTPSELLGFLSSLNLMYTGGKGAYPMLGYIKAAEEGEKNLVYNLFSLILSNNYSSYLTDNNKVLFNDLLSAVETFVLIGTKDGAFAEFNTKMEALSTTVGALTGDDATNFEEYCGDLYDKYYALYEISSGKKTVELTAEETALVNELQSVLNKYVVVYGNIYSVIQSGQTVADDAYPILYALYARATEIRTKLLSVGSENAILSLYALEREFVLVAETTVKYTIERAYYLADSVTTSLLTSMKATVTQNNVVNYLTYWDLYKSNDMEKLLADMADIMYSAYFTDGTAVEHAAFVKFMSEIREYGTFKKSIVMLMNIDDTVYRALTVYYKDLLTEAGHKVNTNLIIAEMAYNAYIIGNKANADYLTAFKTAMESVVTEYAALSDAEKTYLSDMYNYYSALLEEVKKDNSTEEAA